MARKEQKVDSLFGQSPVFDLQGPGVNPEVVSYIRNVRLEALRTTAVSEDRLVSDVRKERHQASMYDEDDEDDEAKPAPKSTSYIEKSKDMWMLYFEEIRQEVCENGYVFEGYDNETLQLLLHLFVRYLETRSNKKGLVSHLLNIFKSLPPLTSKQEDTEQEIDDVWAEQLLQRLKHVKVNNISDVQNVIVSHNAMVPKGLKQWQTYLIDNEPTHSIFEKIVSESNIWNLVQIMDAKWVETIALQEDEVKTNRFSQWLFYVLLHLPTNVTATNLSELRDLAKRCSKQLDQHNQKTLPEIPYTTELNEISIAKIPNMPNILELALTVIAIRYGQRDLIP